MSKKPQGRIDVAKLRRVQVKGPERLTKSEKSVSEFLTDNNFFNLNKEQINILSDLKYVDGSLAIDVNDPGYAYEFLSLLRMIPFDDLVNETKKIKKDIRDFNSIFESQVFENEQIKENIDADIFLNRPAIKSNKMCPNCKQHAIESFNKQLVSADEGTSVVNICNNCGFRFIES